MRQLFFSIRPPPPRPPLENSFLNSIQAVYLVVVKFIFKRMRYVQLNVCLRHMRITRWCYHKVDSFCKYFIFKGLKTCSHQTSAVGTTMQTTLTNSLENWLMYMIFVLGFVIEVV